MCLHTVGIIFIAPVSELESAITWTDLSGSLAESSGKYLGVLKDSELSGIMLEKGCT